MLLGLKNKLSDYQFTKLRTPERNRKVTNIKQAKNVALIYTVGKDDELIKKYIHHLKAYQINVHALGFYPKKELHNDLISKLGYDYFCIKDLNFYHAPKNALVENFIQKSFDILIDTSIIENKSIRFVSTLSKAMFKVGFAGLNYASNFDMAIQLPKGANCKELLKNLDTYLHLINKNI